MEKNYFAAIELGSLYVLLLVVTYHHNKLDVVAFSKTRSSGFYDGKINDFESLNDATSKAFGEILDKYKISVNEVILVLPNNNHKFVHYDFACKIMTENQIIGEKQVEQAREQIRNVKLNDDEILVEETPIAYCLDNDRIMRSAPISFQSSFLKLISRVHILPKNLVFDLKELLRNQQVNILANYLNCSCGAFATTNGFELESECIHINFGQEITTISAFSKNLLISSSKINFGLATLVSGLSGRLKVNKDMAIELLDSYFVANVDVASEIVFDEDNNLSEKLISSIVLELFNEYFDEIIQASLKLMNECNFTENFSYLITGCLNDYSGFIDLIKEILKQPIIEGKINLIGLNSQLFVNCYGAIKLFMERNPKLFKQMIESDDNLYREKINTNHSSANSNENRHETNPNSRFKDIFDD